MSQSPSNLQLRRRRIYSQHGQLSMSKRYTLKSNSNVWSQGHRQWRDYQRVVQRHIFIFNTVNTTIASSCSRPRTIKGSAIVIYKDCIVNINGLINDDSGFKYEGTNKLLIQTFAILRVNNAIEQLNLHKLHLQALISRNDIIHITRNVINHLSIVYTLFVITTLIIGAIWACKSRKISFVPMVRIRSRLKSRITILIALTPY